MVTIPTIDQISGTTVMNKMRSLITNYIDFGTQVAGELSYMMNVIENLPQDITDVYNKATIDAMFANVYQKSETYSKTEVNNLISTIGSFHAVIVDSLPQYGDEGVIYLLQISESGENRYKEYIWVNRWELIGELSNIDLANYYTKTEIDTKFGDYYNKTQIDALCKTVTAIEVSDVNTNITSHTNGSYRVGNLLVVQIDFLVGTAFSGNVLKINCSQFRSNYQAIAVGLSATGSLPLSVDGTTGLINAPWTLQANTFYRINFVSVIY